MKVMTTKSKNSESFYIAKSYINNDGRSTSKIIRKLGTLADLSAMLHTDRDGVMAWAREQARLETVKYKNETDDAVVMIPFHPNRLLDYDKQKLFTGGYLFLQSVYYGLKLDSICRKIRNRHKFKFDLNAILSDLVYARVLEPSSKCSSFQAAGRFLEPPSYELHDVYRALSILAEELDLIQAEVYKNSFFFGKRNDRFLYYDCTNYYFEIEQEEGDKKYGKSKEHRPNPIIQMGLFTDGDGLPLAFSLFPGSQNEQKSMKPLEQKILQRFGCQKFIYCSDAGLASEDNRAFNHMGKRSFIVTQSIKKLPAEDREWALDAKGFKRLSDDSPADLSRLTEEDRQGLFYKEEPYTTKKLHQRLIITYSPRYAAYQKAVRAEQVSRAEKMIAGGSLKKQRKNPNDPARFVNRLAVTREGEKADIHYCLDLERIAEEEKYDGLYAVCTDLLDDDVSEILKVSEGRWQIEDCFRTMKTDFEARPVYVSREDRIKAHFLTCFLALLLFRLLKRELKSPWTTQQLLRVLRGMEFADIEEQGFTPVYERNRLTDELHEACGFRTDYQFITKRKMKEIEKKSKRR
ncbi:MAG TPA: IS1634 family transposase [Candidatus Eisenbergiella merdipullorum]|uniref:IS1634 family transposase n=1 Tax=Candidatus Eisenbergiella merdipullorum TaxID=2838553 RepID=A0A9D2L1B3_9FIRM|nr:IS1634 family transposase [Candidatus Eisenbergiella merdipullorum]